MRRRSILLLTGSLAVAACSSEEASPVATGAGETLPPAATTAAETTTTTVVEATTTAPPVAETTLPPATVAPTTTTPPPSGVPIDATIPLLIGGGDGAWLSLGSWAATAWEAAFTDDGTPVEPAIPAGSTLAIVGLQAGATSGVTGAIEEACFDERFGPSIDAPVTSPNPPGFGYSAIALPATWPLEPRPVVKVDADIPAYAEAGAAVFADAPVDTSLGAVEQIVLADLDGDGDEEALVVFEYVDPAAITGAPGDFSTLLLVDTASGTTETVLATFVEELEEGATPVTDQFRVLGVADLNGDGRMEVAVHTWYYEGAGVLLYEYDGTTLNEAIASGCGA